MADGAFLRLSRQKWTHDKIAPEEETSRIAARLDLCYGSDPSISVPGPPSKMLSEARGAISAFPAVGFVGDG